MVGYAGHNKGHSKEYSFVGFTTEYSHQATTLERCHIMDTLLQFNNHIIVQKVLEGRVL